MTQSHSDRAEEDASREEVCRVFRVLLSAGASCTAKDTDRNTPERKARRRGPEVLKIFREMVSASPS